MKNPTMADVAAKVGVSKTTISRYLKNHPYMKPELRARIEAAIQELGYTPNPLVTSLMQQVRNNAVTNQGLCMAWFNTHADEKHWSKPGEIHQVLEGAREQAAQLNCHIEPFWTQAPKLTVQRLETILSTRGIQGILIPPGSRALKKLPDFNWESFAVISINPSPNEAYPWHSVGTHAAKNFQLILRQLAARNYRRIGFAMSYSVSETEQHISSGLYLFDQSQRPKSERLTPFIHEQPLDSPELQKKLQAWIGKEKPEVIICWDGRFKTYLEKWGYAVPEDMGLVHLCLGPDVENWSGINRHSKAKGRAAVEALFTLLLQNTIALPEDPYSKQIPGEWIHGSTTRPA